MTSSSATFAVEAHCDVLDPEHQSHPPRGTRTRSTRRTETDSHRHEDHRERVRLRDVELAGATEEAEDRDRQRRAVRAREEDRRAELAERDREREACGDRERARDDRKVDLAPHPPGRCAEQRRRLALALVDRSQRRRDDANDEGDRDERLHDRDDPRRRRGSRAAAVSNAITKPSPSITADAPSGSMSESVERA